MNDETKKAIIETWHPALDQVCKIALRLRGIFHEEPDNAKRAATLAVWRAALLGLTDALNEESRKFCLRIRPSDDKSSALAAMLDDSESLDTVEQELRSLCEEYRLDIGNMLGDV